MKNETNMPLSEAMALGLSFPLCRGHWVKVGGAGCLLTNAARAAGVYEYILRHVWADKAFMAVWPVLREDDLMRKIMRRFDHNEASPEEIIDLVRQTEIKGGYLKPSVQETAKSAPTLAAKI